MLFDKIKGLDFWSARPVEDSNAILKVKLKFLRIITIISAVLIMPFLLLYLAKADTVSFTINATIELMLIINLILIQHNRLKAVNVITFILIYTFLCFSHEILGANFSNLLSIVTVFLILSYTAYNQSFKIANAITAILCTGIVLYFLDQELQINGHVGFFEFLAGGLINIILIVYIVFYFEFQFNKAVELIISNNQILNRLSSLSPFFLLAMDKDRKITYVNLTLLNRLQMRMKDVIGKSLEEINPAFRKMEQIKEDDLAILNGQEPQSVYYNKFPNPLGEINWYESNKIPIKSESGAINGLMYISVDSTERHIAKLEREHLISLLSTTIETVGTGILVIDQNQKVVLWNQDLLNIWNLSEDDFKEKDLPILFEQQLDLISNPPLFKEWIQQLIQNETMSSSMVVNMVDGEVYEVFSQAQYLDDQAVGRIFNYNNITKIRTGEMALMESESRYRGLFNEYPVGIVISDLTTRSKPISCNQKAVSLFNTTRSALLDGDFISHSADFQDSGISSEQAILPIFKSYKKNKKQTTFNWLFKKQGGELFLGNVTLTPLKSLKEELSMIMITDITDLASAQKALKSSEEKYRTLVEELPNGVIQSDSDGEINYVSRRTLSILGYKEESDLLGRNIWEIFPEDDAMDGENHQSLFKAGEIDRYMRYKYRKRSGELVDIEFGGKYISSEKLGQGMLIGILRDVSIHVKKELELIRSEERHRLLFETNFDGLLIFDESGIILDINEGLMDLMHLPEKQEIIGQKMEFVIPELAIREEYDRFLGTFDQQFAPFRIECTDLKGETIFIEIFLSQIIIAGRARKACAIKNIVERKLLAEKESILESKQAELETLTRTLASNNLFSVKKNKLLEEIRKEIITVARKSTGTPRKKLLKIAHNIDLNLDEHEQMLSFRLQFEKVHPDFFQKLMQENANLTSNELKLAAFIKLNMSINEIRDILHVERKTIEMAKYRMKKKLGLDKTKNLNEFLLRL